METNAVLASTVDALLEPTDPIATGRQSKVFGLRDRPSRVYKHYRSEVTVDVDLMLELIELSADADDEFRRAIEHRTGWPRTLVVDDDSSVNGVLLQRAPLEFFIPDDNRLRPRTLDWLYVDPDESARVDIVSRLGIARSFLEILRVLHQRGYGHGDISDGNVLWSHKSSAAYLLDCDGVARGDLQPVRPRPKGTADWLDPEQGASRVATDRYQAALFVWRVVLNDHGNLTQAIKGNGELAVPQRTLPGSRLRPADLLDDDIGVLWERAFRLGGAHDRPTMDEWLQGLRRVEARVGRTAPRVRRRTRDSARHGLDGQGVTRQAPGVRRSAPIQTASARRQSSPGSASKIVSAPARSAIPPPPSLQPAGRHTSPPRKPSIAWALLLLLLVCVAAVFLVLWAMSAQRNDTDESLPETHKMSLPTLVVGYPYM